MPQQPEAQFTFETLREELDRLNKEATSVLENDGDQARWEAVWDEHLMLNETLAQQGIPFEVAFNKDHFCLI